MREGSEREARPDLEARGEDIPLPPLDEDSNPSIPTPPQAAAAYKEVIERMAATDAPVFVESAPRSETPTPGVTPPLPVARPEAVAVRSTEPEAEPEFAPTPTPKVAATPQPKPTPPVAPVDPSKASFSLLGWLKGGG